MGAGTIGGFMSLLGIAALLASLFTAAWLNRLGPRRLAIWASVVSGAAVLLVWIWPSTVVFALSLSVYWAAGPAIAIASQMLVITRAGMRGRDYAVGMHTFYSSLGNTVGPLAGSAAVAATGHIGPAFLVAAGANGVAAGVALRAPREDRVDVARYASILDGFRTTSARVKVALVAILIAEFAYLGWATFFPLALQATGRSPTAIGLVFSVYGIMISVVRPLLARLAVRFTRVGVLVVSFLLYAAGLWLGAVATSTALIFGSAILVGLAVGLSFPITMILVTQDAEEKRVGGLLAARFTSMMMGGVVGPVLTGIVAGFSVPDALAAVGTVCAAVGFWILWRVWRTPSVFLDTRKSAMLP
jgi:predicted MFS family arabinose efflux permease